MPTSFRLWLQRRFDAEGWSVSEAARHIGVNHTVVSAWLRGARNPSAVSIAKIAKALRLDTAVVMEAAGQIPPGDTPDPNSNYAEILGLVNRIDWETNPDRMKLVRAILREMVDEEP